eukprot:Skav200445  [mRNA]  locus=scaffold1922:99201:99890:- [translate_table: standard]
MRPTAHMVNKALFFSGASFDREQDMRASQGKPRRYRIVEASAGTDLKEFYRELCAQFEGPAIGLPRAGMTTNLAKTHFKMLSRAGCAMHMLLRRPRTLQPYKLFQMLHHHNLGIFREGKNFPCLNDELAAAFYEHHPEWDQQAECILSSIADSVSLDVAQIETRHAISRRMSTLKSLQTWPSSIETVSAEWAHRQCNKREEEFHGKVAGAELDSLLDGEPLLQFWRIGF